MTGSDTSEQADNERQGGGREATGYPCRAIESIRGEDGDWQFRVVVMVGPDSLLCSLSQWFANEADAQEYLQRIVQNEEDKKQMGRVKLDPAFLEETPWGWAQKVVRYAEGIYEVETDGHGGFVLDEVAAAAVPEPLRTEDGYYEEDSEWALVALSFPHLFTSLEREHAVEAVRDFLPDAYEAFYGVTLGPDDSYARAWDTLFTDSADKLIAVSASSEPGGHSVRVVAIVGGHRGQIGSGEERVFRIDAKEWEQGNPLKFIVDPDRHEEIG